MTVSVLVLLLAQALPVEEVLARHLASLGGREALRHAVEVVGAVGNGGTVLRQHLRFSPPGFREVVGLRAAPAPSWTVAWDGTRSWLLGPDGSGELLAPEVEAEYSDRAFLETFAYFDLPPGGVRLVPEEEGSLPDRPGIPPDGFARGVRVVCLAVSRVDGRDWHLLVDPETGILHERHRHEGSAVEWVRLGAWKRWDGISLPSRGLDGSTAESGRAGFVVEAVRTGLALPDSHFQPPHAEPRPSLVEASPLLVVRAPLPGSGYFFVPEVLVAGLGPFPALLDTGASGCSIEPAIAAALALPRVAEGTISTIGGKARAATYWVPSLRVGSQEMAGTTVTGAPLFQFAEVPASLQPRGILGSTLALQVSVLLDLEAEKLHFRSRPVASLLDLLARGSLPRQKGETGQREVVEMALGLDAPGGTPKVEAVVDGRGPVALTLDTGFPAHLRLGRAILEQLGLPTDREEWLRRGAFPFEMAGAAGAAEVDLIARLDSLRIGSVAIPRPWAHLALGGDPGGAGALLGAAALLPFPRVGLDGWRKVLELEIPDGATRVEGGGFEVAPTGEFVGFSLAGPRLPFGPEPECLPHVMRVFPGGPAARAGVREGDFLRSVGGVSAIGLSPGVLYGRLWARGGGRIELEFRRGEEGEVFTVQLP
jgi:hypothetical protein